MRKSVSLVFVAVLLATAGCDALRGLFGLNTVRVTLVNSADYSVDVDLYISDQKDVPESVLVTLGDKLEFTLSAGESQSFSRSCDDLKAIVIHDATLRVLGGVGPDADSNVVRRDNDFDCGDQIIFTFDHSATVTDFHVSVLVQPQAAGSVP